MNNYDTYVNINIISLKKTVDVAIKKINSHIVTLNSVKDNLSNLKGNAINNAKNNLDNLISFKYDGFYLLKMKYENLKLALIKIEEYQAKYKELKNKETTDSTKLFKNDELITLKMQIDFLLKGVNLYE